MGHVLEITKGNVTNKMEGKIGIFIHMYIGFRDYARRHLKSEALCKVCFYTNSLPNRCLIPIMISYF